MVNTDVSGIMAGVAGIIGALAALMTAIVAFKNSKSPAAQAAPQPFAHGPATAPQTPQYVQGVPNAIQPKLRVSTTKLILRAIFSWVVLALLLMWYGSLFDIETPQAYLLLLVILILFVLAMSYAIRLLYRLLVVLFVR